MGLLSGIGKLAGGLLGLGGDDASKQIGKTGEQSLALQREGLDYAKTALDPRLAREQEAADLLFNYYKGDPAAQSQVLSTAQSSPFFEGLLDQGRQGVGASLSATGGLRGGAGPESFYMKDQEVLQNLVNQQLSGLGYFARPTDVSPVTLGYNKIADTTADIGTAQAQAQQTSAGQGLSALTGIAGLFI